MPSLISAHARVWALAGRWLLPVVVVAIVLGAWIRGHQLAVHGPYGQPESDATVGELLSGQCVGQTFVADAPGLYRVEVFLATYLRTNRGPLTLHLRASPFAASDLATVTVEMAGVRDNAYQAFEFAPVALPAGVPAFFCLEAPAATSGNALTVGGLRGDAFPTGQALLSSGAAVPGVQDLAFQLYYRPSAQWAVAAGLERLAASKPGWFGRPGFYTALFATYVALLAALAWGLGGWLARPAAAQVEQSVAATAAMEPAALPIERPGGDPAAAEPAVLPIERTSGDPAAAELAALPVERPGGEPAATEPAGSAP
jgi:hypothetical protein